MEDELSDRSRYDFTGSWEGNNTSGSARVHQGHVINVFPDEGSRERASVLRALYTEYVKGKDRNPQRTPGTCRWVLDHRKFIRWRENPSAAAIWVSAEPGSGKSVLSRALVDEHLVWSGLSDHQHGTICYFFFKEDDSSQNTAQAALCALLCQLFLVKPDAIKHATSHHREMKDALGSSLAQLWSVLETAAQDPATGPVICILDALDECEESSRVDLIRIITDFITKQTGSSTQLKFFMTSRPYPEIEWSFRSSLGDLDHITLRPEEDSYKGITAEINLVIKERVEKVFKGFRYHPGKATQRWFINELQAKNNRTYLWLALVLDDLARTRIAREDDLLAFINQLPPDLDTAYDKLLGRILPQQEAEAKTLFQILLVSKWPLTLKEMDIALAIGNGQLANGGAATDLKLMGTEMLAEHIKTISYSFVNVVNNSIYFLHQTAREFLISRQTPGPANYLHSSSRWKGYFGTNASHWLLAKICMVYLLVDELNDEVTGSRAFENGIAYRPEYVRRYLSDRFKFLKYALSNWNTHYRRCGFRDDQNKTLCKLSGRLCVVRPTKRFIAMETFGPVDLRRYDITMGLSGPLYNFESTGRDLGMALSIIVAAQHGLSPLVELAVKQGAIRHVKSLLLVTKAMVDLSYVHITRALISKMPPEAGLEALLYALQYKGNLAVARSLIDGRLVQPNSACLLAAIKRFAIQDSIESDLHKSTILELILSSGVDPNQMHEGDLPLTLAIDTKVIAPAKHLLEFGADVNKEKNDGELPLFLALENFLLLQDEFATEILKLLLQYGAKPNQTARNGQAKLPLEVAMKFGALDGIKLLLDAGADRQLLDEPWQLVLRCYLAAESQDWGTAEAALEEWLAGDSHKESWYSQSEFIRVVGRFHYTRNGWETWPTFQERILKWKYRDPGWKGGMFGLIPYFPSESGHEI